MLGSRNVANAGEGPSGGSIGKANDVSVEFDSGKEEMDKYRALAMYNFTSCPQYDRPIVGQWS